MCIHIAAGGVAIADVHTFTLVAGSGDTHNALFAIAGGDQLDTEEVLDYETMGSSLSILVQADDGNGGVFAKQLSISLVDGTDPTLVWSVNVQPNGNWGYLSGTGLMPGGAITNCASGGSLNDYYVTGPTPDAGGNVNVGPLFVGAFHYCNVHSITTTAAGREVVSNMIDHPTIPCPWITLIPTRRWGPLLRRGSHHVHPAHIAQVGTVTFGSPQRLFTKVTGAPSLEVPLLVEIV